MIAAAITIKNQDVLQAFLDFPPHMQPKLLALRALILQTAATTDGVGPLEETLKWGEPAYLTSQSKRGSTIRLGWNKTKPTQYAMYFICHTNLVARFRQMFPDQLTFDGDRAIIFEEDDMVPTEVLSICIAEALTYHRKKVNIL